MKIAKPMMVERSHRILIDARSMRRDQNGPSRYAENVLLNLSILDDTDEFTVIVNKGYDAFIDKPNFKIISTDIKPYRFLEHLIIPLMFRGYKFDLFHSMQYIPPLGIKCPTIITLYDALHAESEFWSGSFYRRIMGKYAKAMSQYAVNKSQAIITISRYSASQINKAFNCDTDKIFPIYLGVGSDYVRRDRARDYEYASSKWEIPYNYILSISNMKDYKNVDVLIKAFAGFIKSKNKNLCLVLAGKMHETDMNARIDLIKTLGISDQVIFLRNLNDNDLAALLGGSHIFVFPSKKEGFGLPLLEAMAAGIPCIASDIEVFREVCGNAPLYFHPDDVTGLKNSIEKLLLSDKLREEIAVSGINKAASFSWENTAKETLNVYKKIIERTDSSIR